MNTYIKCFNEIGIGDIASVGGKNSSLGEMFSKLSAKGIAIPDGYAITALAFQQFLTQNSLHLTLHELMRQIDKKTYGNLHEKGAAARKWLLDAALPRAIEEAIVTAYKKLCGNEGYIEVA